MTPTESINLLLSLALRGESAYHPGYQSSVEYARLSKAYFAGVGIDKQLKKFARRESDELFEQRKDITAHVQNALGHALDRPFAKVRRSNFTKVLSFPSDESGAKSDAFQRATLDRFTKRGVDAYVFERVRYWNEFDPNCFVVVEFAPFDNTKENARPYPFEVTADMAVSFKYDPHGELLYLAVRQVQMKPDKAGDSVLREFERLTLYAPLQTVVIQQLTADEINALPLKPAKAEQIEGEAVSGQVVNIDNTRFYQVIIPAPHGYERTPAIRCGYVDNPADDGQTVLGILDAALPFGKKLVKLNSELDLTMALLAFPISVRYQEACPEIGCDRGHLTDGAICGTCRGTGHKPRPTSAQEEIVLAFPDRPEDMIDASKLLSYVYPPTDAVRQQVELMTFYFQQAKEAVFNSQMFTKQETAQTATFHGIELQSVYDTLYPYAQHLAKVWAFLVDACRVFTGVKDPLNAALIFPQDFRFETAEDLFLELKSARESGAGNDAAVLLQERIMDRLLIDDKERLSRMRIDTRFDPFPGMTEAQIILSLSSPFTPEWKKVWYINRGTLMEEILQETPAFYTLAFDKQKALIMAKITKLQGELTAARPALNIGALGDGEAEPDESQNQKA